MKNVVLNIKFILILTLFISCTDGTISTGSIEKETTIQDLKALEYSLGNDLTEIADIKKSNYQSLSGEETTLKAAEKYYKNKSDYNKFKSSYLKAKNRNVVRGKNIEDYQKNIADQVNQLIRNSISANDYIAKLE